MMKSICKRCKGMKKVRELHLQDGIEMLIRYVKCPACKGTGKAENYHFPK